MKRKKFKLKKIKLNKKQKLIAILIALFIVTLTLVTTFGRYAYNLYQNYILESQGFYFNSSVMSMNGSKHSINNWDGVNAYPISIDLNNKKNDLLWTKSDITYDITVECSSNIRCVLNKTEGVIYSDTQVDSYTITIYPVGNFTENQTAEVKTTAKSTYPYVKELSTTYNIGIETSNFSYKITDSVGSKYLVLELTNAFTYYKVQTAFGNYKVGDNISIDEYNSLTTTQKANCLSARVTLKFNPNDLLLDMTDTTYKNRLSNSQTTTIMDSYQYVTGFQFKMDASSNNKIIFYKTDSSKNYTYPSNSNSIIEVSTYTVDDI
ncbi:MAG: hypothetical protein IJN90_01060 [Bacilli bacterium]|nr:hypothetical protein [Bacilli bacterium]